MQIHDFVVRASCSRTMTSEQDAHTNYVKLGCSQQIVRSADSIGANIAEGSGRGTYQENRLVRSARGSLNETQHWLRRAYTRNLLTTKQVDKLKPLIDELAPKLNSYLKSIGSISENK